MTLLNTSGDLSRLPRDVGMLPPVLTSAVRLLMSCSSKFRRMSRTSSAESRSSGGVPSSFGSDPAAAAKGDGHWPPWLAKCLRTPLTRLQTGAARTQHLPGGWG